MKTLLTTLSLALLVLACGGAPEETAPSAPEATPAPEEAVADSNHLGGCILTTPIGEVPDDLYMMSDVAPSDEAPPFTKKLTVDGLTLAARDDASDDFMRLVAQAIAEIFPRDESLDLAKQEEILRNQYLYKALIPVPVGEDFSFFEDNPEVWEKTASQNTICDIIMQDVPGQVMEVVEHILHYVSDVGLHYTFPAEWGISKDSELAAAMEQAIEKGYYEIEQYEEILEESEADDKEEEYHRVLMQEFAYWVISTAWNLQEAYGPVGEAEWNTLNSADLQEKMPELWDMYERTVATVMVAPSLETLQKIGPTRAEERQAED